MVNKPRPQETTLTQVIRGPHLRHCAGPAAGPWACTPTWETPPPSPCRLPEARETPGTALLTRTSRGLCCPGPQPRRSWPTTLSQPRPGPPAEGAGGREEEGPAPAPPPAHLLPGGTEHGLLDVRVHAAQGVVASGDALQVAEGPVLVPHHLLHHGRVPSKLHRLVDKPETQWALGPGGTGLRRGLPDSRRELAGGPPPTAIWSAFPSEVQRSQKG